MMLAIELLLLFVHQHGAKNAANGRSIEPAVVSNTDIRLFIAESNYRENDLHLSYCSYTMCSLRVRLHNIFSRIRKTRLSLNNELQKNK